MQGLWELRFRVPVSLIPQLLALAGQTLEVDGTRLLVGVPSVRALGPAPHLVSRLVVIKGMLEPDTFLRAARDQLAELGVEGEVRLVGRRSLRPLESGRVGGRGEWIRRTVRIKDKEVVGYAVEVDALSPEGSLVLQARGIGGRRRFGCGIFMPIPSGHR